MHLPYIFHYSLEQFFTKYEKKSLLNNYAHKQIDQMTQTHFHINFFTLKLFLFLIPIFLLNFILGVWLQQMSKPSNKALNEFIPLQKQITFSDLQKESNHQSTNISSLMRITEPLPLSQTNASLKNQYSFPMSQTPSLSTSRRNDVNNNSKRLKLKDYLHLSSIQKKNKKSNSSSKIEVDQSIDVRKSSLLQNTQESPSLLASTITEPASKKYIDSSEVLKQDIVKRIDQQIRQLKDLSSYVQNDFKNHQSSIESQFLLFSILNSVINGSKGYEAIGEQIVDYDKGQSSMHQYYWSVRNRGLESPAKMSKKSMEIVMNLAEFLHLKK